MLPKRSPQFVLWWYVCVYVCFCYGPLPFFSLLQLFELNSNVITLQMKTERLAKEVPEVIRCQEKLKFSHMQYLLLSPSFLYNLWFNNHSFYFSNRKLRIIKSRMNIQTSTPSYVIPDHPIIRKWWHWRSRINVLDV